MKIFTYSIKVSRVVVAFLFASYSVSQAQSSDFKPAPDFKNSIKFNVTNALLYDNSIQFSYERMIKENQSINVFGGYQEFPLISFDLNSNASFSKESSRKGYSIGADYRFYLGSINKYKGPRGVYLAPFISFFDFGTDRTINYTDSNNIVNTVNLSANFNLTNIGGELGYQFVLWDRFVVDCVLFGPSLTHYKFNAKLDGSIPGIDENEFYQKLIEAIKDKYPGIDGITGDEGVEKKGIQSITAVGFRYNISIGYRF